MQHAIPTESLGTAGPAMTAAVSACVHCGFCLPACPTYKVLGEEMDSPRGRIVLMKEVLEGGLAIDEASLHLDRCLGCLACESACPSGVRYRDLITPMRTRLVAARAPWARRRVRWLLDVLESPARARLALSAGRLARPLERLLPEGLATMLRLVPARSAAAAAPDAVTPASGTRRGRVAIVTGCVQSALRPGITAAAVRVLTHAGIEVLAPPQGCCGALAAHSGELARADQRAAAHRRVLPRDVDAIVVTAAGCGSWMKEHGPDGPPVLDVAEYLDAIGLRGPLALPRPVTAVYQDACHLLHAQQIAAAPRRLLGAVGGLTLVPLADPGQCCGSAGLYNIEQPVIAADLGRRKASAVAATGATLAVSGNIGCLTQLQVSLAAVGASVEVQHTLEVLAAALPDPAAPPAGGG